MEWGFFMGSGNCAMRATTRISTRGLKKECKVGGPSDFECGGLGVCCI